MEMIWWPLINVSLGCILGLSIAYSLGTLILSDTERIYDMIQRLIYHRIRIWEGGLPCPASIRTTLLLALNQAVDQAREEGIQLCEAPHDGPDRAMAEEYFKAMFGAIEDKEYLATLPPELLAQLRQDTAESMGRLASGLLAIETVANARAEATHEKGGVA